MAYLKREGDQVNARRPALVLLDLNLPGMDGRQVLARIGSDADLNTIPTVILTTSQAEDNIEKSHRFQANNYLSKPGELGEFDSIARGNSDFWQTRAELPSRRYAA
jgi:chemotaxis family two-component system response regulator Rcp1